MANQKGQLSYSTAVIDGKLGLVDGNVKLTDKLNKTNDTAANLKISTMADDILAAVNKQYVQDIANSINSTTNNLNARINSTNNDLSATAAALAVDLANVASAAAQNTANVATELHDFETAAAATFAAKATTLAGYGITDAALSTHTHADYSTKEQTVSQLTCTGDDIYAHYADGNSSKVCSVDTDAVIANSAYNTANKAYNAANSAYNTANKAYNAANKAATDLTNFATNAASTYSTKEHTVSGLECINNELYAYYANGAGSKICEVGGGGSSVAVPTFCIALNMTTNINGWNMTKFSAVKVEESSTYERYKILDEGEQVTKARAAVYMKGMTGSEYVPEYNYKCPKNVYILMVSDMTLWKPQYDNNGLFLWKMGSMSSLGS